MNGNQPGKIETAASFIALFILCLLALRMVFCSPGFGREAPPPDWPRAVEYGCHIEQVGPPPNYSAPSRFRVTVWVRYRSTDCADSADCKKAKPGASAKSPQSADWQQVFSMRDAGKNNEGRKRAMNDCNDWMESADRAVASINEKR